MLSFRDYIQESKRMAVTKLPADRISTGIYVTGDLNKAKSFTVKKSGKTFNIEGNNGSKIRFEVNGSFSRVEFDVTSIKDSGDRDTYSHYDIKGGESKFDIVTPTGTVIMTVSVTNIFRTF